MREILPHVDMVVANEEDAAAASCLAHSIGGDFNYTSRSEIVALMKGTGSGRIVR